MQHQKNSFLFLVLTAIAVGLLLIVLITSGALNRNEQLRTQTVENDQQKENKLKSASKALGAEASDLVEVGGVYRHKRDIEFPQQSPKIIKSSPLPDPGQSPLVPANTNLQTRSLFRELTGDTVDPSVHSVFFEPEPFELDSYLKNPDRYLNQIRPGRVFQSAQPGPDSPPIQPEGDTYFDLLQGERAILRVKVTPGMPVTFHTTQLGEFDNRLKTISVAADQDGLATVKYLAGPGTRGIINILASSPVHAEDVHFMVNVSVKPN